MKKTIFICLCLLCIVNTPILYSEDIIHTIERGETLYSISKKYSMTLDQLCKYNNIADPSKVSLGQKIKIPSPATAGSAGTGTAAPALPATTEYTIRAGDTLYSIARNFLVSVQQLKDLNKMDNSTVIKVGQKLLVPASAVPVVAKPQEASVKPPVAIAVPPVTEENVPLVDPRNYQSAKIDPKIIWPVKATEIQYVSGKVNSVFLTAAKNEKVTVIKGGLVIYSGVYRGFGKVVFIHSQSTGHVYVYGNLDTIAVKKGQAASFGDTLGTVGIDSLTNKSQLNFMVFQNGKPVDPAKAPRG